MSLAITYQCDRCGFEHEDKNVREDGMLIATYDRIPMRVIGIVVDPVPRDRDQFHKSFPHYQQMWCLNCIRQFNLDNLVLKAETKEKEFSLEDHIKEIITHAMKEAAE